MTNTAETERLILRPPVEADRERFIELFMNEAFTVFSGGVHDLASANARFDSMVAMAAAVPYAKQPIVVKESGLIVGYTGAHHEVVEGLDRLEWGWRLAVEARGTGYATEAASALLDVADATDNGEMLCIIALDNVPSRRVADKLGFAWQKQYTWADGEVTDLLTRPIGAGGPPLLAPPSASTVAGDDRPAK